MKNYNTNTSFLDLLMLSLLVFVALFAVTFLLINVNKKKKNTESRADFLITITWPKDIDNDVDTYVQDPEGNLIFYRKKENGLMHLDRDDLGKKNDIVQTKFGPVKFPENREIATIRGTIPGEYTVNVHMFLMNDKKPTPVTVQIDKVNPSYSLVTIKKVVLNKNGDEKTAVRIKVNKGGDVIGVSTIQKSLIREHLEGE